MKPRALALLFALMPVACTDETTDPGAAEFRSSGPGCVNCPVNPITPHEWTTWVP